MSAPSPLSTKHIGGGTPECRACVHWQGRWLGPAYICTGRCNLCPAPNSCPRQPPPTAGVEASPSPRYK